MQSLLAIVSVALCAHPEDLADSLFEYAVLGPARVEIGRNVRIEGDIGLRYGIVDGELDGGDAHPLVMRSDFRGLDPTLDARLDALDRQLPFYDVDGDNRLSVADEHESRGLFKQPLLVDHDGDGHVDEFDLFLVTFDADGDGRVVHDPALAGGARPEFTGIDDALAELIDTTGDGVLDTHDQYSKVRGRLSFATSRDDWEAAHDAPYQVELHGPIRPRRHAPAVSFEVGEPTLPEVESWMFDEIRTRLALAAAGAPFGTQVAEQLELGGEYVAPGADTWEPVPYGTCGPYDYYQRPIFRSMTFVDVVIPKGTNALFEGCTFIGVTWIETNEDCDHVNWNYAGALEHVPGSGYELKCPDLVAEFGNGNVVADTRTESNNLRFHDCTFVGSISGDEPDEHTHWRNRVQLTGATVFAVDPDDPHAELIDVGSMILPGWSVHVSSFGGMRTRLAGAIVADVFEARGFVDIHGTLMLTFRPEHGAGPLFYGGLPSHFVTSLGQDPTSCADPGPGAITIRTRDES